MKPLFLTAILVTIIYVMPASLYAQTSNPTVIKLDTGVKYQSVTGFGASLAYYENWLTAHPNRTEIYNAIFGELSLDILRVRNAYGYDDGMIDRVQQFTKAAQNSLGKPIAVMVTSWGPPAYLKSNNDNKNGGTLKYSVSGGKVTFNYEGFARWWNLSLNDYNAKGIFPTFISIQNEPDYSDTWETCLLRPTETVNSTDTVAGYNKALDAVYDTLMKRSKKPLIIGPETVGIGYNAVENYINALDNKKIDGIAHHLYHGVDENNPYASTNFSKVGAFHPEIPHFQTEYSRGDWFALAGLIYKTFNDENGVAYLYWDLIWTGGGLVDLEFPWDPARWQTPRGYTKTKDFYAFKQYSAFIHPGWNRVKITSPGDQVKIVAFISQDKDSATFVATNTSGINQYNIKPTVPGFSINEINVYRTSANENCLVLTIPSDSVFVLNPHSITTVTMKISEAKTGNQLNDYDFQKALNCEIYPNPFAESASLRFNIRENATLTLTVYDYQGKIQNSENIGTYLPGAHSYMFNRGRLKTGIYIYRIETTSGEFASGKFTICD